MQLQGLMPEILLVLLVISLLLLELPQTLDSPKQESPASLFEPLLRLLDRCIPYKLLRDPFNSRQLVEMIAIFLGSR